MPLGISTNPYCCSHRSMHIQKRRNDQFPSSNLQCFLSQYCIIFSNKGFLNWDTKKNKSFYIFFIYIMSTLLYTQDISYICSFLHFSFLFHDCSSNPGCYFMKVFHQTQCITHKRHILATHQPVRVLSTTRQILSRLHKKYCHWECNNVQYHQKQW